MILQSAGRPVHGRRVSGGSRELQEEPVDLAIDGEGLCVGGFRGLAAGQPTAARQEKPGARAARRLVEQREQLPFVGDFSLQMQGAAAQGRGL